MKHLLAARHRGVIERLAASKTLLAFDFDGTLSPIVSDRDAAGMRAKTRAHFAALCRLYPTAVISGRGRSDAQARLLGLKVKYVIGNHGLEPGTNLKKAKAALDEARLAFKQLAARDPGIDLEDKVYSLAVHYRRSTHRPKALRAIRRVIGALVVTMRVISGKSVINLVPAGAPTKGDALLLLRARARAEVALYVGDDVTDEDVFRIAEPSGLISVRVGRAKRSAAQYFLRSQREVDALITRLCDLRRPRSP